MVTILAGEFIIKLVKLNPTERIVDIQRKLNTDNEQYLLAAVGYLLFLSLVVLFLKRDDPYIKHHAMQGFVLFLLVVLVQPFWALPRILELNIGWIPNLFVALLVLIGVFKALSGEYYRLPVITRVADGLTSYFRI